MKAGIVQFDQEFENKENNIITLRKLLDKKLTDEDILIFPEMTLTGYTMNTREFGEELDGIGMTFFISEAQKRKRHFFVGMIEKDENNYFNSLYHIDNKGIITASYRKIHPFSFAGEEKYYQSSLEPVVTKVEDFKIGLSICYDLRFPELFRHYGKEKCDIIINSANWPVQRIQHFKLLSRARSVENLCYFLGANRIGKDPFNEFSGESVAFDPKGDELLKPDMTENIFKVIISKETVIETRNKYPFLNDIRLI